MVLRCRLTAGRRQRLQPLVGPSLLFQRLQQQIDRLAVVESPGIGDRRSVGGDFVVLHTPTRIDQREIEQRATFERRLPKPRLFSQAANGWSRRVRPAFVELLEDRGKTLKVRLCFAIVIVEDLPQRGVTGVRSHQRQLPENLFFRLTQL